MYIYLYTHTLWVHVYLYVIHFQVMNLKTRDTYFVEDEMDYLKELVGL